MIDEVELREGMRVRGVDKDIEIARGESQVKCILVPWFC